MATYIYPALEDYVIVVRGTVSDVVQAVSEWTSRPINKPKAAKTIQPCTVVTICVEQEKLAEWYDRTDGRDFDDLVPGDLIAFWNVKDPDASQAYE